MVLSLDYLACLRPLIIVMNALYEMSQGFWQEFDLPKGDCYAMSIKKVCNAHQVLSIVNFVFDAQARDRMSVEDVNDVGVLHVYLIQNFQYLAG